MYFDCKDTRPEKQVSYILLMTGDEGVNMYNSWDLSEGDRKNPAVVWQSE